MRHSPVLCSLVAVAMLFSLNSCVVAAQQPMALDDYTEVFVDTEIAEKELTEYITKRTVRVIIRCTIYENKTNKVYKKKFDAGWGTGTIIHSNYRYSLIQTAHHVAFNKQVTNGVLTRKHTGFKFERKDTDNKITDSIETKTKIIASNKKLDIAVIQVFHNFGVNSRFAKRTHLGQSIRIIGFPSNRFVKGKHLSYEKGYIATANMGVSNVRYGTAAYFGNSGGGVWNQYGEVVGSIVSIGGFKTLMGNYIPQQNHAYGPSIKTLRSFYIANKMNYILTAK